MISNLTFKQLNSLELIQNNLQDTLVQETNMIQKITHYLTICERKDGELGKYMKEFAGIHIELLKHTEDLSLSLWGGN